MIELIFLALIVIFGSAVCSMMEAALFSVSLNKAKVLEEQKVKGSARLVKIKESMHRPITVIVIFTNIFNILGSMMVGLVAVEVLGSAWLGLVSAVFTFSIILFSEIIPKSVGNIYAIPISLFIAGPLVLAVKIFNPFIRLIDFFTQPLNKRIRTISEDEIKMMSHLGHIEGSIETDEKEMIHQIFKLNDLSAKDIMTPRTVIEALKEDDVLGEIQDKINSLSHSRVPVYRKNLDDIIGVCHQRDLLMALSRGEKKRKIKEFVKEDLSLFVSEDMKIDKLIPLFQKQKTHLAIVNDGFKGTAGVVTLEDVLEQIVGEIVDETDKEVDLREKAKELKKNGH